MPNVVIQHVVALESVCLMEGGCLCDHQVLLSRRSALYHMGRSTTGPARGAQHWAQHATVGMSTEQRNHKRHTFSWLNKGDPVQVRNEQAAGMSSDELASAGVGRVFFQKASPLLRCRRLSISGRVCKTTSCLAFGAVTLPLRRQSWQPMCTAYMFGSQSFYAAGWLTIPHRNSCTSFDTTCCSTFVNA